MPKSGCVKRITVEPVGRHCWRFFLGLYSAGQGIRRQEGIVKPPEITASDRGLSSPNRPLGLARGVFEKRLRGQADATTLTARE
jgi:hypothetical protein